MNKRWLFPTREQWKKWSLPSKLGAIGTYTGIISLIITIVILILPQKNKYVLNEELLTKLNSINLGEKDVFNLFAEIEKDIATEMRQEEFQEYSKVIFEIYESLTPKSQIEINKIKEGKVTKQLRRVDIFIQSEMAGHSISLAVKLLPLQREITQVDIKVFKSLLEDLGITRGVIVSNSGFAKQAVAFAKENLIDLCFLTDVESRDWNSDFKIPVIRQEILPNVGIGMIFSNKNLKTPIGDFFKVEILYEGDTIKLFDIFANKWDSNEIPHIVDTMYFLPINSDNLYLITKNEQLEKIDSLVFQYRTGKKSWIKYFKPDKFKGIENSITGHIKFSELEIGLEALTEKEGWHLVKDFDQLSLEMRGIRILVQETPKKLREQKWSQRLLN